MKIAIPDIISNSYFPAAAAVELGFFKDEGLDMTLELIYPGRPHARGAARRRHRLRRRLRAFDAVRVSRTGRAAS